MAIRSTCSRIPESSPVIGSTSSSASRSRASRATCSTCSRSIIGGDSRRRPELQPGATSWLPSQLLSRRCRDRGRERFVVLSLRLLALSFAVVGILFIAVPNGVLDVISDLGDWFGNFTRAPHGDEQLWLALGFAYMVVITGICLVAQTDVVRYRPLLLVLAAGKTASSLASLAFFLFDEHVFAYLLNFLVDGSLVADRALALVAGRPHRPPRRPRLTARAGALGR